MSSADVRSALSGEEIPVDFGVIERSLAELWKSDEGDHAVTKAALWNVVAHSTTDETRNASRDILSAVSASVPQRTILVNAQPQAGDDMRAWISANCHIGGGGMKVCSEEITIVARGSRIDHIPPVVQALLIPDMPVATWWLGDLPNGTNAYLEALLDPADRLIVDSCHFDSPADLHFVHHLASDTQTRPADLNWSRVEDWRTATASMFDVPELRSRMRDIARVTIEYESASTLFGEEIEARLYATWLLQRIGYEMDEHGVFLSASTSKVEVQFRPLSREKADPGVIVGVHIQLRDGAEIDIHRNAEAGALRSEAKGVSHSPVTITRLVHRKPEELITRELGRSGTDCIYIDILPLAARLSHS